MLKMLLAASFLAITPVVAEADHMDGAMADWLWNGPRPSRIEPLGLPRSRMNGYDPAPRARIPDARVPLPFYPHDEPRRLRPCVGIVYTNPCR